MAPARISTSTLQQLSSRCVPLRRADPSSLAGLVDSISKARVVMLGEASHGTHEFYDWRSLITQLLIAHHGFSFVAVEADWPATQIINKEILCLKKPAGPEDVRDNLIRAFKRWPTWMWANIETEGLIQWMLNFNLEHKSVADHGRRPVKFYGLDLYSLFESIDVVLTELKKVDPALTARAKRHYACFEPYAKSEEEYMQSLMEWPEGCMTQALKVLNEILRSYMNKKDQDDNDEIELDIKQNARIEVEAESYYRQVLFSGSSESWNVRDRHMLETLDMLLRHYGREGKAVVWAHNTHIGDYRATSMVKRGSVNLGGLAREKYGEDAVALVGFGTYQGNVIVSHEWAGPIERMRVPPAKEESYEDLMHMMLGSVRHQRGGGEDVNDYYLLLGKKASQVEDVLEEWRGNRAIGVVYNPALERLVNYVPTQLMRRYDAFVFVGDSTALRPLTPSDQFDSKEVPESWPTGV